MRLAATALSVTLSLAATAKETVRIAFVGPLTGGNSAIGLGGRNASAAWSSTHSRVCSSCLCMVFCAPWTRQ